MYFIYVLQSLTYGTRYIGNAENILKRLKEHNLGKCRYTSGRKPWKLVYDEKFSSRGEAIKREKFLKSGQGRKYLDNLLK
jgi:predicted GIY-YIG superfamily endonuclease